MALVPCRECGKEISSETETCPLCGIRDPSGMTAEAAAAKEERKKKVQKRNGIGCLGFLVIVAILSVVLPDPDPSEERESSTMTVVADRCVEGVKARLRSPSTADFPLGISLEVQLVNDTLATLRSRVDAQDALGATIRTNFYCRAVKEGNTWNITVEFLE